MIEFINYNELKPWEKDIVDRYPAIYREPNPRLRDFYEEDKYQELIKNPNFTNLRYGFEFGAGWAGLVDKFSKVAQELVNSLRHSDLQPDAYINACIFKSKMGHLEWQGDNNLDEPFKTLFRAYTIEIGHEATSICENTGEPGCMCKRGGWMKVLCYKEGRKLGFEPTVSYYREKWNFLDKRKEETKI